MAFNTVFKRVEIKYLIPRNKIDAFRAAMEPYMQLDEYGLTTIQNIYYDTVDNTLISRSLDKPSYKEKLRLRSYGIPENKSTVFVELKKKVGGIVYKRRAAMCLEEAIAFLEEGKLPSDQSQIVREIDYFRSFYGLKPAMFIAYDREAYYGKQDPSLRMTLDQNIRYREETLDLVQGDAGRLVDQDGGTLLEIKCNGALPLYVTRILTGLQIFPASFSKYGKIYTEVHKKEAVSTGEQKHAEVPLKVPFGVGRSALTGSVA